MKKYGYFDTQKHEYIITDPRTPVKWINYIGTLDFGGFVDHTGGALLCKQDPAENRITRYVQQMPSSDFKGTTLYLRVKDKNGYRVFSPFFVPTLDPYDLFECHVGLGYSTIVSLIYGVRTEVTIFVPPRADCEIRDIRITNQSGSPLEIDVIPVVEYSHPHALKQFTNADWVPQTMVSRQIRNQDGTVTLVQYPFMFRDMRINYFTSNTPVSSFQTDRKHFLGDNEYGTWAKPRSLEQQELGNNEANRGDNIAALMIHCGKLKTDQTKRIITQLGQAESIDKAQSVISRFRKEAEVDAALSELKTFWNTYLSSVQVHTPDTGMNQMLNVHNAHQCYITKNWSRYLSYYQLGYGARGIGMRDSAQDVLGVIHAVAKEGKELIRKLISIQLPDGSAMHQMNPLTGQASIGDAEDSFFGLHYYSDDHLWFILVVCEYIKETGDFEFLSEIIPYYDVKKKGPGLLTATVLSHMRTALEFTQNHTGKHGLPLLGHADWNDTVNLPAGAESFFTANLYGAALTAMIGILEQLGETKGVEMYRSWYDEMARRVNEHGWDGEWYIRWFDDKGKPVGSCGNKHGIIHCNGQSWPVLSGFATPERAIVALQSVNKLLNTRYGIKLTTRGYDGFDPKVGGITTYPPGAKENGGIFLHTNPWVIIAETIVGNGDRAFEYYCQINPAQKNDEIDRYEIEPYVYAQNILADEHPQFGLGRNSWLSGTASWAFQAGIKYILGIRPEYTGLRIDPCIPKAWDGFKVTRKFRGSVYEINVANPKHVSKGVARVEVDGEKIEGNLVPLFTDADIHKINVTMG